VKECYEDADGGGDDDDDDDDDDDYDTLSTTPSIASRPPHLMTAGLLTVLINKAYVVQ